VRCWTFWSTRKIAREDDEGVADARAGGPRRANAASAWSAPIGSYAVETRASPGTRACEVRIGAASERGLRAFGRALVRLRLPASPSNGPSPAPLGR
jgi:hypothetical protein